MSLTVPSFATLRRYTSLLAYQAKNAAAITGGTISNTSLVTDAFTGSINSGIIVVLANDFSATSNTTLADISGLSRSLTAGTYKIFCVLFGSSASSGGWKLATSLDAAGLSKSTTLYSDSAILGATINGTASNSGAVNYAAIEGTVVVPSTTTFTVQFAQETSNVVASVVSAGSFIEIVRIA